VQLVYAACNEFGGSTVTTRRLALLFADRLVHARVADAARGHATVWLPGSVEELVAVLPTDHALAATLVFLAPARLADALQAIDAVHQAAPEHPVVGYADPRSLTARFILETGRARLTDLVLLDLDDSRAVLHRVLQQAEQTGTAKRLADVACADLPRDARVAVQYVFRHLREPLDASAVAAGLGLTRRTLYHRLQAVGSPGPRELVGWCRVLFIAHQLSTGTASMQTVASQLDFPCWRNASALVRRYLGVGTNALRRREAFHEVLAQFRAEFRVPTRAPVLPAPTRRLLVG
jgi:AraC-like DNA-binding protein